MYGAPGPFGRARNHTVKDAETAQFLPSHTVPAEGAGTSRLKGVVEGFERKRILDALATTGGNQRSAAKILGLLPTTLNEKLKRFGILKHARRRPRSLEPLVSTGAPAEEFRYRGTLAPGRTLEVLGLCGSVEVTMSLGAEFEIVALNNGTHAPLRIDVHLTQQESGVTLALTPKGGATNVARPGSSLHDLHLTARIPLGTRFLSHASVSTGKACADPGCRGPAGETEPAQTAPEEQGRHK
jgi:hypothetical protein